MEKTLKVEGMMCPKCEGRVKRSLERIDGVESATASHEADTATVVLTADVTDDALIAAVSEAGYKAAIA